MPNREFRQPTEKDFIKGNFLLRVEYKTSVGGVEFKDVPLSNDMRELSDNLGVPVKDISQVAIYEKNGVGWVGVFRSHYEKELKRFQKPYAVKAPNVIKAPIQEPNSMVFEPQTGREVDNGLARKIEEKKEGVNPQPLSIDPLVSVFSVYYDGGGLRFGIKKSKNPDYYFSIAAGLEFLGKLSAKVFDPSSQQSIRERKREEVIAEGERYKADFVAEGIGRGREGSYFFFKSVGKVPDKFERFSLSKLKNNYSKPRFFRTVLFLNSCKSL